jgi:NADH-quinone oxidoreductase subunit G
MEINKWWICDEGRFNFKHVNSETRVTEPSVREGDAYVKTSWQSAIDIAKDTLGSAPTVLVASDLTNEEIAAVKKFAESTLHAKEIFHFGTPNVLTSDADGPEDRILKTKSKTANLRGAEKQGIKPLKSTDFNKATLVVTSGRAELPKGLKDGYVLLGVVDTATVKASPKVILPGLTYVEKTGTVTNIDGVEQKFIKALDPRGESKATEEVLKLWK